MAFHGYSPTVSDPFRAPCDTCSENSSSGFWTGGELRTAFSDEVAPCLLPWMIVLRFVRRNLRRCPSTPIDDGKTDEMIGGRVAGREIAGHSVSPALGTSSGLLLFGLTPVR